MLARDYWLISSSPRAEVDEDAIHAQVNAHVAWLLDLEQQGVVLVSGPLLSGPGVGPGSGITVIRAEDEASAEAIASSDPFVVAGLRVFQLYRWRLNEGSVSVRFSLGAGSFDWE